MCERCDNFNKHLKLVNRINEIFRKDDIDLHEGIAVLFYMCGVLGACPVDAGDGRNIPYESGMEEGWLVEEALANIHAAYRRVLLRETRLRKDVKTH